MDSGRASGVRIRVLDFGVAKLTNPSRSRHLSTAVGLGTALYMAPEQQLNAASVDGRADLYAVGVMLYEMLTEHLPLGRFRAPSEERKDLPPEIDALALCLLDREPDLRFDDAGALLRAIERARAAIQSRTTRRAVRRRRRRTRRLKRSTLLGPVAGVAMLILLGGGMIRLARSLGARPHSPAVARSAEPPQSDLELEPVLELEPRLETEPVLEVEPFVSPSPPPRRWAPRKEPSPVLRHAAQIVTSQVRGLPVPEIPSWAPAKKPSAMVPWALGKLISAPRNMALPAPPSFRPAKQPSAVVRAMADSVTAQLQRGAATIRTIGTIETPTSVAPPVTATPAPTGWSGEPLPARLTRGLSAPSLVYTTSRIDPASGSALTIEMVAFRGPSGDTRYAARTEATRGAYAAFCEAAPRKAPPPTGWPESSDHPVVNVSFRDAEAFAKWLGLGLPTEAEWIALAGGPDREHPWGDAVVDGQRLNLCDRSCPEDYDWKERTIDDGAAYTAPVGSYPAGASPSGALDLLGNVSEWCIGDRGAPLIKGGSWDFDRAALNLGWSSPLEPTYRDETIGIRLVLSGRTTR
ncbi:MAG: SUMF1/EgtB/PvdO family nonheme iron enzyme [Planctomycetota bacterium]